MQFFHLVAFHRVQFVICHGYNSAFAQEHRDTGQRDGHFNRLAALIAAHGIIPVKPACTGRQIDFAGYCPRLQYICHQNIPAKKEGEAFLIHIRVFLEFIHQRTHDGRTAAAGFILSTIQIRRKAIAQLNGFPNQVG